MTDLPLTAFDVAVLLIVGLSGLLALVRGATREALTMAAWIGALVVAYYGFGYVRELAQKTIEVRWIADVVALVVIFVVPLIVFKTVASAISEHVAEGGFGMADRLVGMVFGVVRGAVIVCGLYLAVGLLIEPEAQPAWMSRAALLPYVQEGAGMLQDLLPADAEENGRRAVREASRDVVREFNAR
jgi:membrane protein required for colicin V production